MKVPLQIAATKNWGRPEAMLAGAEKFRVCWLDRISAYRAAAAGIRPGLMGLPPRAGPNRALIFLSTRAIESWANLKDLELLLN